MTDVFDQFDPDKVGDLAAPQPHREPRNDAFSQFDPYPDEEVTGFDTNREQAGTSATGAFLRGAERSALPSLGSLPAIGAGAEAGAVFGPWGAVAGGVIGGLGGGYVIGKAQDWALSHLPDSWTEKIGLSERQRELDEKHHGVASFLGGLAPYAVTMRPGGLKGEALPDNATALQRIMAHPLTARVFGGAVMGGLELGQEAASGQRPDWGKAAIATGFGVVFNRPTAIGERIIGYGARPMLRLVGKEQPAPVVPETAPQTQPITPAVPETEVQPAPAQPPAPPVTAVDWRHEITERTRTGKPYELPPTVAQAGDLKVMGPGITEDVFQGSREQAPEAADANQQARRIEQEVTEPPRQEDVHVTARRMHADLFARYEAMKAAGEATHEIEPQVQAAYRRAAEATGAPTVEPEPSTVGSVPFMITRAMKAQLAERGFTAEQIADMKPAQAHESLAKPLPRTIEQQRDFIRDDVARQLLRAGRPKEEAEAAGALIAVRYETRAALFKGARGTAEDLYREEGAEILGPGMRSAQGPLPPRVSAPRKVNEVKLSLLQFLAHRGGLQRAADLEGMLGKDPFVPGFGRLFREGGMTQDRAREALEEAGYIEPTRHHQGGEGYSRARTDIRDLHAAINDEARGRKRYRIGHEPPTELDEGEQEYLRESAERELLQQPELAQAETDLDRSLEGVDINGPVSRIDLALSPGLAAQLPAEARAAFERYQALTAERDAKIEAIDRQLETALAGMEDDGRPVHLMDLALNAGLRAKMPAQIQQLMRERDELLGALEFAQSARGKINILEGRRPIITLMREANASTFIHETGHDFLEQMARDAHHEAAPDALKADMATTLNWLRVKEGDKITTRAHEKFARGFEQYLREGTAPSPGLASVFAKFRGWLLRIYESIKGLGAPINEDIRQVFDRMLAVEPQRTVIAPEREPVKSLADVHKADIEELKPEHADAGKARIDAEWHRGVDEIPDDLDRKSQAEAADFIAKNEPAGSNEPGGTPGGDRGGPEAIPAPGKVEGPGGGETGTQRAAKSSGVPSGRQGGAGLSERPGGAEGERAHLGDLPLAPHPAADLAGRDTFNVGKNGNIRTENITSVEQFQRAIEDAKERIGGTDEPMTDGQVMDAAQAMGFTPEELTLDKLVSAFGGVRDLNKKVLAFRMAVRDQAERVGDLMRRIQDGGETEPLTAEYAKERTRFDMFMSILSSVTTEWGRAGRSFRNLEGWDEVMRVNLAEMIKSRTGRTLFQLKMEAKLGAALDTPAKIAKYLRDAQKRSFGGMALEYFVNNLISGVSTHVTYMIGNKLTMLQDAVPETLIASAIGSLRSATGRQGERVHAGEAWQQVKAVALNLPKSLQGALEAVKTGQPTLLPGQTARPLMPFYGDKQLHLARNIQNDPVTWHELAGDFYAAMKSIRDGIVGGAALVQAGGHAGAPLIGPHWSPLGQIPDVAIRGVPVLPVGSLVRLPGRAVSAIHSMDTIANYSRYIAARAYREAVDLGLDSNARARHIGDRTSNPPVEWMEEGHKQAYAQTLMGEGGNFVKRLSALINFEAKLPGIGSLRPLKFIDPFVHIGANVIEQAVLKRTPLGILSEEIRNDLLGKNGNVAQDYAMARMLAGTAMAVGFGSLAMEGYVTGSGPSDPKEAATWREVYQPHSVRIGDMWYQVNRLGPMGMHLGIAADLYEVARDISAGDMLTAAAHLQHAITQNILDESFMRGPSELIKALDDPGRYGEAYIKNFASSFVPFSVGMYQMNRAADPYTRQARTVMDAIMQRVPGMSQYLQPKVNVWGEDVPSPDAFGHAGFTAVYLKRVNEDPVRQAMLDLGIAPAAVERKIRNVDLTDEEYTNFARWAGRMAKTRLDAIVGSPDWRTWPNHIRHDVIAEVLRQSREAARGYMMMRYPHIPRDAVEDLRERRLGEPEPIR